jgi:DeoR/GlpR family transcriptional regulator of sugar metabolism
MAGKRPTGQRIKIHRSYDVTEAARALGVAKGTVRRWLKDGLPCRT